MKHLGSHVPEGKEICSHVVLVFFTFTSRPKELLKIIPKAILPGFSIVLILLLKVLFLGPTVLKESDFRLWPIPLRKYSFPQPKWPEILSESWREGWCCRPANHGRVMHRSAKTYADPVSLLGLFSWSFLWMDIVTVLRENLWIWAASSPGILAQQQWSILFLIEWKINSLACLSGVGACRLFCRLQCACAMAFYVYSQVSVTLNHRKHLSLLTKKTLPVLDASIIWIPYCRPWEQKSSTFQGALPCLGLSAPHCRTEPVHSLASIPRV